MQSRKAGVLLPIASLPGPYGVGDIGPCSKRFIDSLKQLGASLWQMLPVNEADSGGCPYSSPSAFGGDPLLLSLDWFVKKGLLQSRDLQPLGALNDSRVDWAGLREIKIPLLRKAFAAFTADVMSDFVESQSHWLKARSRFFARAAKWGPNWPKWTEASDEQFSDEISFNNFLQFCFMEQWRELRRYANDSGISLVGDLPMFVSYHSADVWTSPQFFKLDEKGRPLVVAGAPPDQFTDRGQNWGSPVYDWQAMRDDDWSWWRQRIAHQLDLFDCVRIDHFRGLAAVWEIPCGGVNANDARKGAWRPGGGRELLQAILQDAGSDAIIVEDLGVITPDVDELRDSFHLPTMRVLQFGLEGTKPTMHWPENFPKNCVAYTGTHDNTTLQDWLSSLSEDVRLKFPEELANPIRTVLKSNADWTIIPAQDWLGLGRQARINVPGTVNSRNWSWRMKEAQWYSARFGEFREWIKGSGRVLP